ELALGALVVTLECEDDRDVPACRYRHEAIALLVEPGEDPLHHAEALAQAAEARQDEPEVDPLRVRDMVEAEALGRRDRRSELALCLGVETELEVSEADVAAHEADLPRVADLLEALAAELHLDEERRRVGVLDQASGGARPVHRRRHHRA